MTPSPFAHDRGRQAGDRPSWSAEPGACFLGPRHATVARRRPVLVAVDLSAGDGRSPPLRGGIPAPRAPPPSTSTTSGRRRCAGRGRRGSRDRGSRELRAHRGGWDRASTTSTARVAGAWSRCRVADADAPRQFARRDRRDGGLRHRRRGLARAPKASHRFELHRLEGPRARDVQLDRRNRRSARWPGACLDAVAETAAPPTHCLRR